ncbi:Oxidoreductase family, C-terminal alpha/beta domain protein [[Clostridium] ultunense Esp]|nr:Oxidoreductase family, C-terminal alpha/beta domain protein [[Clostridium] ultunense Esp]
MSKVRVAVVGAGTIAEVGHLPYYQKHPEVELTAIVDRNEKRARDMKEKFSIPKTYPSLSEMIKSESIDAISICTPNVSHVPLCIEALKNGIDVLVEKPLAVTYHEAKELQRVADNTGRIVMVGMTHRFRNESQVVKRLTGENEFGKLYYVKAQLMRRRGTPKGWFTDYSMSGGGALMDIGVHALDLAWWLVGKPVPLAVSGFLYQGLGHYRTEMISSWKSALPVIGEPTFNVEDFVTAFFRFQDQMVLHLEVSWAIEGPQDEGLKVFLYGEKGGAALDPLRVYGEKKNLLFENQLLIEKNNPYEAEINHFIEAVKERTKPMSPLEDGVEIVKMLEGAKISSEQGREIDFHNCI